MDSTVLLAFLQVLFENIAKVILDELELESGNKRELGNLINTLSLTQAFLKDAEERQQTDEAVNKWLDQLRDFAYDANDLLDELATEAQRRQLIIFPQVRNSLSIVNPTRASLRRDIAHRIMEIKKRLDDIENSRRTFGIKLRDGERHQEEGGRETTSLSYSYFPPLGRENDKRRIIDLLVSSTREAGETGITVIPVLGMSGIGKTTLAQLVCSDELVGNHFDLKLWVHVSRDFNVSKITRCIIEGIQVLAFDPISLDVLQKNLRRMLSGRKYLLVLDDVWSRSPSEWEMLRGPLLFGEKGSKILVTTRSEAVAQVMGTVDPYRLQGLSDDDCWSIFHQHALSPNSPMRPDFNIISNEIVNKCKGNPLAAKSIGLRLRGETDTSKWGAILQNYMTEFGGGDSEILRSIKLSYQQLPACLKPCFAYCSIFPKGYLFDKELLVQLWMAQNFLQPRDGERMEDVGEHYFDFLVQWSFFQYSHFDYKNEQPKFTMHSVIHDFAKLVAGVECNIVEIGMPHNVSKKTRHCSLIYDGTSAPMSSGRSSSSNPGANIFEKVNACNSLYTLLAIGGGTVHRLGVPASKFIRLRTLDLSDSDISEIPKSIKKLKHLRYLHLRNTNIRRLPESLGCLYNLQTLGLRNCYALEELPKNTRYLHKLRHLDLRLDDDLVTVSKASSSRHSRWGSLGSMPPRIGELTELQTLSRFVVGTKKRCGLSELQKLNSLRGELLISNLHHVRNAAEATGADLFSKEHLHQLELRWGDGGYNALNRDAEVLGSLKPHTNIKKFNVVGYKGESFPSWIGHSSFSNIISLVLSDCKNCQTLPSLGQLPSLKALYIKGMDAVSHVDCAFCGTGTRKFPALEKLHFERMSKLQAWCGDEKCELRSLHELVFKDCVDLRQITHKVPSLTKLVIEGSRWLIGLPSFPSLKSLDVKASGEWIWESCRRLPSLSSLTIAQLPTRTEPLGLQRGSSPLRRLEISHCDQLASLPDNWLPVSLTYLAIRHCPQLRALPWGLKDLIALEDMEIEDCPQLQTLPDSLPKALQFLSIDDCPALSQLCLGRDRDRIARLSSVWIDKRQVVSGQSSMD